MGLNMDNIHIPSIASGPTTGHASTKTLEQGQLSLMELHSEKQRIEEEVTALSRVLESHGVDINTSLNTPDGFPRDDIDIPQIRHTRVQIIRLRNDWKELMSRIEKGLHEVHASYASNKVAGNLPVSGSLYEKSVNEDKNSQNSNDIEPTFARISEVFHGAPAEIAGLKVEDRITRFGNIKWTNHEKLSKVAETVQRNEGQVIIIKLLRPGSGQSRLEPLQLELIPRRDWGGRGLLGCHIVPL